MSRTVWTVAVVAALAACSSGGKGSTSQKVTVATATAGDVALELLVDDRVETGLTPLYLRLTSAGQPVTDATVTLAPEMTMTDSTTQPPTTYSHGAPVLGPPAPGADGLYRVDVVFQMPSSAMGSWAAKVGVSRSGGAATEATIPLTVADSGRAKVFMYTDPQTQVTSRYVMSLNLDEDARVGLNPITVTLHRRDDLFVFTPIEDATFALDPEMPEMSHGAPGSVHPTPASTPGVYHGLVSFSMTGHWVVTVAVSRGGVVVGSPAFVVDF